VGIKVGTTYKAYDSDGNLLSSGASLAPVIQAAIDHLTSGGTVLLVLQGTHSITSTINLADGVIIQGMGGGSTPSFGASRGTVLQASASLAAIVQADHAAFAEVRDVYLDGNGQATVCAKMAGRRAAIRDCVIVGATETGVLFTNSTTGGTNSFQNMLLTGCYLDMASVASSIGVKANRPNTSQGPPLKLKIENNIITNAVTAIKFLEPEGGDASIIRNNYIDGTGILIDTSAKDIVLEANHFITGAQSGDDLPLVETSGDFVRILGNDFRSGPSYTANRPVIRSSGNRITVVGNTVDKPSTAEPFNVFFRIDDGDHIALSANVGLGCENVHTGSANDLYDAGNLIET